MYLELIRIYRKVYSKKIYCLIAGLLTMVGIYANNVNGSSVPMRGSVPINYYQMFMIGVALIYGIYLLIRARRRKRNGKFRSKGFSSSTSEKVI